jgi:hypothetical protein
VTALPVGGHQSCPSDRCYGCWELHPRQGGYEADIMDLRTGRRWCHECAAVFISWELDGRPDEPGRNYAEWVEPDGPNSQHPGTPNPESSTQETPT